MMSYTILKALENKRVAYRFLSRVRFTYITFGNFCWFKEELEGTAWGWEDRPACTLSWDNHPLCITFLVFFSPFSSFLPCCIADVFLC